MGSCSSGAQLNNKKNNSSGSNYQNKKKTINEKATPHSSPSTTSEKFDKYKSATQSVALPSSNNLSQDTNLSVNHMTERSVREPSSTEFFFLSQGDPKSLPHTKFKHGGSNMRKWKSNLHRGGSNHHSVLFLSDEALLEQIVRSRQLFTT